jgi:spore coat protein U-like protein
MKKVLAIVLALATGDALAASATSTFQVTATVKPSCTIGTTTLNFAGTTSAQYDPLAVADLTVTNNSGVTLTCSKNTPYTLALSAGGAGSFAPRHMTGPGTLNYNIYTAVGGNTVWGDGSAGTQMVTQTQFPIASKDTPVVIPMYAVITAGQDAPVGVYTDSITATINF